MFSCQQLSQNPTAVEFHRKTGIPPLYAALGVAGFYFIMVFFNIGSAFLVNTVGFLIPGYYSLKALFTTTRSDDTQVRYLHDSSTLSTSSLTDY